MSDVLVKYVGHGVQNIGHVWMSDDFSYSLLRGEGGGGGLQNGRGGNVKIYAYEKGGQKKFWGSFYAVA